MNFMGLNIGKEHTCPKDSSILCEKYGIKSITWNRTSIPTLFLISFALSVTYIAEFGSLADIFPDSPYKYPVSKEYKTNTIEAGGNYSKKCPKHRKLWISIQCMKLQINIHKIVKYSKQDINAQKHAQNTGNWQYSLITHKTTNKNGA